MTSAERRGDARLVLDEVDSRLASFHRTPLLTDPHTAITSGEPAQTAEHILAALGQYSPISGSLLRGPGGVADVLAEGLRILATLRTSLLTPLLQR